MKDGKMFVVCCVCGKDMGSKSCAGQYDGETTHTYCDECMALELEKLEKCCAWHVKGPMYPGGLWK
ncbi:MAG: hypothetical protein JRH07_08920 [Deltaproteobacteria bacterium]|nr:hypothetical protein [Deltaproteobacteria bacterium]